MIENILVVKLGGGQGLNWQIACFDIARIARIRPVVVVHGVSAALAEVCAERGIPVEMLTSPTGHSSRYTPSAVRDVFVETASAINASICTLLAEEGVMACGLVAEPVLQGERKQALRAVVGGRIRIIHDDYSGSIVGVEGQAVWNALADGMIPIIPPYAASRDGWLNVDGDRASAALAVALNAAELVILSNVPGLLRQVSDPASLVPHITSHQIDQALGWAQGRMKRKILGAQAAVEGGVHRVILGDGRINNPVQNALNGAGTMITR